MSRRCWSAALTLLALSALIACGDDTEENEAAVCGPSNTITFEGAQYCVVNRAGFRAGDCPSEFPVGEGVEGLIVCGERLPPDGIEGELRARGFLPSDVNNEPGENNGNNGNNANNANNYNNANNDNFCPERDNPTTRYIGGSRNECTQLEVRCNPGEVSFFSDCGCGCLSDGGLACPEADEEGVRYASQDEGECADIDFNCFPEETSFSNTCGCGCLRSDEFACPDPDADNVSYASADPDECAMIELMPCPEGQQLFSNSCGCGCEPAPPAPVCQPANAPGVRYVEFDDEQCRLIDYTCNVDEEAFEEPGCGCGCLVPELLCPDPDVEGVQYVGESVEECAMVLFECEEGQERWSSDCGCGCLPDTETRECPLQEGDAVTFGDLVIPQECTPSAFIGELFTQIITSDEEFAQAYRCPEGTSAGVDFEAQTIVRAVNFNNITSSVAGVVSINDGQTVIVQINAPAYCGGPPPDGVVFDLVVESANADFQVDICGYDHCDGPPAP